LTIPNLITIARLFAVPLIVVWLLEGQAQAAFLVFVAAGISDAVDGILARRFGMGSRLGAYLDPLADKALLVSIYVTLAVLGFLPVWLSVLVVSRDVLIIGGVLLAWVLERPLEIRPLMVSKANTLAQILLAAIALAELAFALGLEPAVMVLSWAVAGLTIASAGAYVLDWIRHMAD
jgi:cardiolipin synthase